MMKFFLINLHFSDSYSQTITTPPLGPGYLLAALARRGFESRYYEFSFDNSLDHLLHDIRQFQPDLIGFSLRTHRFRDSYRVIDRVADEGIPIVLGGAHVNANDGSILRETRATFLIRGEGEESLPLLLEHLRQPEKYPDISGLVYRADDAVRENPPQISDITQLLFPTFEQFDLPKYPSNIRLILSSRGCPYRCTFCQQSALLGKKWRRREPEDILREMEYWAERGFRQINFADDNLTLDRPRIQQLCRLIRKSTHRFYLQTSGVRIDNVDEDTLKMMKDCGFYLLSFGIESGNDRVLREIRKGITVAQIHRTLRTAWKLGFDLKLYFIINNRTETCADVRDSFQLARAYPIVDVRFTNLFPYPGTYDYDWIRQHGRLLYPPEEYLNNSPAYLDKPLYDGPGMTLSERVQVIREAEREIQRLRQRTWVDRMRKIMALLYHGNFKVVGTKVARTLRKHY